MYTPPEPLDDTPGDLEGNLSTVTDEEWRAAHERLYRDIVHNGDEFAYPDRGIEEHFAYEWSPDVER